MKIPQGGFTLEDICNVAKLYAVYIHIGVAVPNIARVPARITLQVTNNLPGTEPVSFDMDLLKTHPRMNEQLSRSLLELCQRISPQRLKITL